jgi:hypothetical protein
MITPRNVAWNLVEQHHYHRVETHCGVCVFFFFESLGDSFFSFGVNLRDGGYF